MGDESIAEFLLDENANVDAQDEKNEAPLIIATRRRHDKTAQILVSRGANLHLKNIKGETAFTLRCERRAAKKNDSTGGKEINSSKHIKPEKGQQKIKPAKTPSWNQNF